ncbi:succinyl-diaminopimelate desuccinylase [Inhella inkyongensis]|uniref:Succinyl-diaminopimelate desuccinylase n=1 Tax=Inhella inkyongensis TaxID=392593 RepID=A0A840S9R8_9BURK|nr:succinyl-diaminopimelate desuccinylase [Inhella inkyongensis]MBB5205534.1 succinyl-diaminopimelate desuccinylase [Inhella inkyongensis]
MSPTLELLEALLARPSVTPADAGCLDLISERLQALGFACERLDAGPKEAAVSNLWAIRPGRDAQAPVLVLAGHTDVVPTGPLDAWTTPPFTPSYRDGRLYARGAADMKSSLAAFVVACEAFVRAHPEHPGSLALLLTSDEEGPALHGTVHVVQELKRRGQRLDACIVGEPTSVQRLGDTIKNGRRGSLSGRLTVKGIQGHVAYPQLARNPIHQLAAPLAELAAMRWDEGNAHFPPTSFQVSNIQAGTGAGNVIPGSAVLDFNFRFSTASTPEALKARVQAVLEAHGLEYQIDWVLGGEPFLTEPGTLTQAMTAAIRAETGVAAELSTTGGTSDGRFIAKLCPQVVEFGPINASIHQLNEWVTVADLDPLTAIYRRTFENLLL